MTLSQFSLPQLQYDYEALEPVISRHVMELHHSKHHQTYVDKLNVALESIPQDHPMEVEGILCSLESIDHSVRQIIRNNGGGHYNHSLFWQWLSPEGGGEPSGTLSDAIVQRYDSYQSFVDAFTKEALGVFGSGWVWLLPSLDIVTSPNQDSPIMSGGQAPILGLDVWEHAYYLDYENKRNDYIHAWWNVVNWHQVANMYDNTK